MRLAPLLLCVSLSTFASAATAAVPPSYIDAATLDAPFTLQNDAHVPGKLLKPGGYTIVIKDHLSDRAILQVKSSDGKVETTFLGVFHSALSSSGSPGPINFATQKGHEAIRGFKFPGGGTVEFVYPKAEAAAIVTKSPEQVLAVDPASDNLHLKGNQLSREDAQIVTLWSLHAVKVTAGQNGIAAQRYVQKDAPLVAASPAPVAASSNLAQTTQPSKRSAPPASSQVASNPRRPSLAVLPHTSSNLPLLLLAAMGSFAAAIAARFARSRTDVN